MRIASIEPEDKGAGQSHGRCDANARHRPEIGQDLGDPSLPQLPCGRFLGIVARHPAQFRPQRFDQSEQRRCLMSHLMKERGCDAASDHALARHLDDGHRIGASARQAGAGAPNGGARSAIEIADDGRSLEKPFPQSEGVGGSYIQARQPHARLIFTALRDDVFEQIELREHGVEAKPQYREPPLRLLGPDMGAFRRSQPSQEFVQQTSQSAPAGAQELLDGYLRGGQQIGCGKHRLLESKRPHAGEAHHQSARFLLQHPGGEGGQGHVDLIPRTE